MKFPANISAQLFIALLQWLKASVEGILVKKSDFHSVSFVEWNDAHEAMPLCHFAVFVLSTDKSAKLRLYEIRPPPLQTNK